jgi:hypothetical protein
MKLIDPRKKDASLKPERVRAEYDFACRGHAVLFPPDGGVTVPTPRRPSHPATLGQRIPLHIGNDLRLVIRENTDARALPVLAR